MTDPEVILREIQPSDTLTLVRWRNANAEWFPAQAPWTAQSHLSWYRERYLHDPSINMYMVCVRHPVSGADFSIGVVTAIIKGGAAELGMMILGDKDYARGGYMRAAINQLMKAYGLGCYWLRVMPHNEATIRFHCKNGFLPASEHGGKFETLDGQTGEYLVMARSGDGYWPEVPA